MDFTNYNGYQPDFLDQQVPLPELDKKQKEDVANVDGTTDNVIHYINYSLVISKTRGFPYFTASNIDGEQFRQAPRKDKWRKDPRVSKECQWGPELYTAAKSDFDKGHMTKREDVQWGDSDEVASLAALSTFYYTNAVPQSSKLNQKIWRKLEDYILHSEAKDHGMRISVFTGPVISKNDPLFVTPVKGKLINIPSLFWKVVVFRKSDNELYRVGFLMSQASLLKKNGIVKDEGFLESLDEESQLFMEFDEADTYQVNIDTIEKLTQLKFPKAKETYKDSRKIKLILEKVDVLESMNPEGIPGLDFDIIGIKL